MISWERKVRRGRSGSFECKGSESAGFVSEALLSRGYDGLNCY